MTSSTDRALRGLGKLVARTIIRGGIYRIIRRLPGKATGLLMILAAVAYVMLVRSR